MDLQPVYGIPGAFVAEIQPYRDTRGAFMESFRREWFPQVSWDRVQSNCSISQANVLRGLHYHFHQIDYWFLIAGRIQVALVDLRASSPHYLRTEVLIMDAEAPRGLFIPVGVAHGFYAITDVVLTYTVNNYFDGGSDEHGVAWNDPALKVPWRTTEPRLSDRDARNPLFADIPEDHRPL